MRQHLNDKVQAAIVALNDALVEWERNTGRRSILIIRETDFCHRSDSGKPVTSDEITDEDLLGLVQDDFPRREFSLVPPAFTVLPDDDVETATAHEESFFGSVLNFLGYDPSQVNPFKQIQNRMLEARGSGSDEGRLTDDRIVSLIIRNVLVATIMFRRNDGNYVEVSSACYLNPENYEKARRPKEDSDAGS